MKIKPVALGTLAYALVTFPLAVVWHLVAFHDQYQAFGYFQGEPTIALGFLTILIQGLILSALYPHVSLGGRGVGRGVRYALAIGAFFWTSHVLAFVAKNLIHNAPVFVLVETFYLFLQFLIYGVLIGWIYRETPRQSRHPRASQSP